MDLVLKRRQKQRRTELINQVTEMERVLKAFKARLKAKGPIPRSRVLYDAPRLLELTAARLQRVELELSRNVRVK